MKNHLKKLITNKTYLFVIMLLLFLLPPTLAKPAQSELRAIAVSLGIDWEKEQYKMSAQIVIPTIDVKYNQNTQVVCVSASSVVECIDKINLVTGKELGLMHCGIIALGDTIADKGVTEVVDFFLRSNRMDANTVLISTPSAYELLMAGLQIDNGISLSLENLIDYNKKLIYATETSIEDFYQNLIQDTQSTYIGRVEVVKELDNSIEVNQESKASSGAEEGGSSSSGGSGNSAQGTQAISNIGKTALFKSGKKVAILEEGEIKGFNWLRDEGTDGVLSINNLKEPPYHGGGCVVNLEHKYTTSQVEIDGITPIIKSQINVLVKLEEIKTTPENENQFNKSGRNYITKEVEERIKQQILQDVEITVSKCKEYNVDILNVIERFKKLKPKEYKKLLKFYASEDEFFQACKFQSKVVVRSLI